MINLHLHPIVIVLEAEQLQQCQCCITRHGALTDENKLKRKKVIRKKLPLWSKNILSGKKENIDIICKEFDWRKDQTKTSVGTVPEKPYAI